ncbi:MAG: hypothetical protein ABIP75_00415 [Pyrinomonadaceae bacterium]
MQDLDKREIVDEILLPVREKFASTGMSEEELDALVESERQSIWEKNTSKPDR